MSRSIRLDTAANADAQTGGRDGLGRFAGLVPLLFVVAFAVLAAPASAAPPQNDARTAPQELRVLPAVVTGTTVDATLEPEEPVSGCGPIKNSVWFAANAADLPEDQPAW
jgi:hypothetical protein